MCFDFCIFSLLDTSSCSLAVDVHSLSTSASALQTVTAGFHNAGVATWRRGYSGLSMLAAINQRARILKWQRIVVSYLERQVLATIEHLWNLRETRYYNSLLDERLEDLYGDEVWSD